MSPREGAELATGWFRRESVPWDDVLALVGGRVELTSGRSLALPPPLRPEAARALAAPSPSGAVATDVSAWLTYIAGAWSPVRASRALLALATAAAASDLHLEAGESAYAIRLRQTGELAEVATVDRATGARLIAALKHLAGCMPYRCDLVQEGTIAREGVAADVRASFMPTALGERAALRLFGKLLSLDDLGLGAGAKSSLETALQAPSGLVLVAGPSGGGKTTTLYAALAWLAARRGGAHLSLEDPVEQRLRLAGIAVDQVELRPERGLTAEVALVGALRQDIDVLAVGEIRTAAEAALALQAAHTGRLVLAGLHAGSAPEALQRMADLGADPRVLAATWRAVLFQRLITVSCRECAGLSCPCGGVGRRRVPEAVVLTPAGAP